MLPAASSLAATITGVVTDRTTGKPSSGDTVAVINTSQSMDEIAKATSDGQGHFSVNAPDGGQILLHVTHAGAEYFKSMQPGAGSVDIDVYDSAKKIDGISGEALVLRAETDATGKMLNVAENFFVQNASAPPRTEYGGNTFDFYLPKGAQVLETLASAPGGLPTNTKLVTLDAANGHYAFTFPIRPGETRFQVAYLIPYNGTQAFALKLSVPTGDVAVMVPKTMQFQGSAAFQPLNDPSVVNSQSYDAHQPAQAKPIEFTLSGTGQLPESDTAQGGTQAGGGASGSGAAAGFGAAQTTTASGQRPGGGMAPPDDPNGTNDPWAKYKWWIVSLLGLALVAGAGIMLKGSPAVAVAGPVPVPQDDLAAPAVGFGTGAAPLPAALGGANPLLQALKDELFALEADRLAGKLTDAEYAQQKAAFDVVLRRALSRTE